MWSATSGSPDWTNGTTNVAWTDGTDALFGAAGFGTVTLSGSVAANSLTFNTPGYTLSSGTLALGAGGLNAGALSSGTTTIGSNVYLAAGGQTWSLGSGATLALGGALTRATGATVTFNPAGTAAFTTTSITNSNNIVGPWATIGSGTGQRFATVSGGSIVPYTGANQAAEPVNVVNTTGLLNWDLADASGTNFGNNNGGANVVTNTIRYTGGTALLNFYNKGLWVNGLMAVGAVGTTWEMDTGAGNLEAGSTGELVISGQQNVSLYVNNYPARIADNTTSATGKTALTYNGPATLTLGNYNTHTGGTIVNGGTLALPLAQSLTAALGNLTINPGGTVNANTAWGLGYNGSGYGWVNGITINGGVLNFYSGGSDNGGTSANSIVMTGGTISGNSFQLYNSTPTFTVNASTATATISSGIALRLNTSSATFNVAQGTTAGGTDLLISGPIFNSTFWSQRRQHRQVRPGPDGPHRLQRLQRHHYDQRRHAAGRRQRLSGRRQL